MTTEHITCIPAYGRDYKSKEAVLADWNAYKDFLIQGYSSSGYVNKEDAERVPLNIRVRYDRLRKVVNIPCLNQ